jgi:hypothetical protein
MKHFKHWGLSHSDRSSLKGLWKYVGTL